MQTVKVLSTRGKIGEVTLEGENLKGEDLKNALRNIGIDLANTRLVVSGSNIDVTLNTAVLPTGDFTVLMVAAEIKLGTWGEENQEDSSGFELQANDENLPSSLEEALENCIVEIEFIIDNGIDVVKLQSISNILEKCLSGEIQSCTPKFTREDTLTEEELAGIAEIRNLTR